MSNADTPSTSTANPFKVITYHNPNPPQNLNQPSTSKGLSNPFTNKNTQPAHAASNTAQNLMKPKNKKKKRGANKGATCRDPSGCVLGPVWGRLEPV